MRKADIANQIFKQVGISKNEAADILELVLNLLKGVLQKGESVKIAGFGNFVVRSKGSRKGRNPRTGEAVDVPGKKVPFFKPGKEMEARVLELERQEHERAAAAASGSTTARPGF